LRGSPCRRNPCSSRSATSPGFSLVPPRSRSVPHRERLPASSICAFRKSPVAQLLLPYTNLSVGQPHHPGEAVANAAHWDVKIEPFRGPTAATSARQARLNPAVRSPRLGAVHRLSASFRIATDPRTETPRRRIGSMEEGRGRIRVEASEDTPPSAGEILVA